MIKYTLQCNNLHQFESWFRTSDDYEKLNNEKMLSCAICGSKSISKSLMSPSVSSKEKKRTKETLDTVPSKEQKLIKQLKKEVEKNCEYVGDNFEKEARLFTMEILQNDQFMGKQQLKKQNPYTRMVFLLLPFLGLIVKLIN